MEQDSSVRELTEDLEIQAQAATADARGALAMLEAAEANNIKMDITVVAEKLGHEKSPFYRRHGKQDKRWNAVLGIQETSADHEDAEYNCGRDLAAWLEDELSPAERASIRLQPVGYVDDYCLTPMQLITGEGESAKTFTLGQSFNFRSPAEIPVDAPPNKNDRLRRPDLNMLPEDVQVFLQQKRDFWATLGVTNGGELDAFVDEYFAFTEIDLASDEKLPAEVEWLFASMPLARNVLEQTGIVRLRHLKGTPPAVLDHIHAVSQSQHRLVGWLKSYITEGQQPIIHESDHAAIDTKHEKDVARLRANAKLDDFRRELLIAQQNKSAAEQHDFDDSLLGITNFAKIAYGIEATIPDGLTEQARDALLLDVDELNEHLDEEFGGASALEHMLRDVNARNSEGIIKTLKLASGLIVGGEIIHLIYDQHPEWSVLAVVVFMMALAEDPLSESGEAFAQRTLGYSWREIAPRYKLIGPVALSSIALGLTVKWVGDNYGEPLAALDFALASCATTGATLYKTIESSKKAYEAQVAAGKVPGRVHLDEASRAEVRAALTDAKDHETAMAKTKEVIHAKTGEDVSEADLQDLYAAIEQALINGDIDAAVSNVSVPFREALRAAWSESFGTNPARKGKLVGMAAMLGSAPIPSVAHLVFNEAIATMLFSMGEPMSGIAATYIHKFLDGPRRAMRARKAAAALRDAQPTATSNV